MNERSTAVEHSRAVEPDHVLQPGAHYPHHGLSLLHREHEPEPPLPWPPPALSVVSLLLGELFSAGQLFLAWACSSAELFPQIEGSPQLLGEPVENWGTASGTSTATAIAQDGGCSYYGFYARPVLGAMPLYLNGARVCRQTELSCQIWQIDFSITATPGSTTVWLWELLRSQTMVLRNHLFFHLHGISDNPFEIWVCGFCRDIDNSRWCWWWNFWDKLTQCSSWNNQQQFFHHCAWHQSLSCLRFGSLAKFFRKFPPWPWILRRRWIRKIFTTHRCHCEENFRVLWLLEEQQDSCCSCTDSCSGAKAACSSSSVTGFLRLQQRALKDINYVTDWRLCSCLLQLLRLLSSLASS